VQEVKLKAGVSPEEKKLGIKEIRDYRPPKPKTGEKTRKNVSEALEGRLERGVKRIHSA